MKYHILLYAFLLNTTCLFSFNTLDTLSIKGYVKFFNTNISGNFIYTIKNNEETPQNSWTFLINPSINISSISQNNIQAKVVIKQGINYRILTVTLPQTVLAKERTSIVINFSITEQNNNSRILVKSDFVFLDARQFWFPYPIKDHQVDFEITIITPTNLTSIMGGKLNQDTIIVDKKLRIWKNELKNLSPSTSLIILETPKQTKNSIYLYSSNTNLFSIIDKQFSPIWDQLKKKHKFFPLSEIHIIPLEIVIPNYLSNNVDGEFLGNIFLLNTNIINLIDNNTINNKELWTTPSEQLVEILIHELYHSFFPGILQYQKENSLFTESLVQYFTWDLINSVSPKWGNQISQRTRYYIQNIYRKKQFNYLWEFLQNSTLLFGFTHKSKLDGITLADTLVEKYQFIGYTEQDIYETIQQHKIKQDLLKLTNKQIIYDYTNKTSNNPLLSIPKKLFNSSIKVIKTNFNIYITNEKNFNKQKIVKIPVNSSILSIQHNYPFTWFGQLKWVENNTTNTIDLQIPKKTIWETNLIGDINYIQTISPLDIIENQLYDNIISNDDIGKKIIYLLNNSKKIKDLNISISPQIENKLVLLTKDNKKLQWDSSFYDNNKISINAFIIDKNHKQAFITIPINIIDNVYIIDTIIDK